MLGHASEACPRAPPPAIWPFDTPADDVPSHPKPPDQPPPSPPSRCGGGAAAAAASGGGGGATDDPECDSECDGRPIRKEIKRLEQGDQKSEKTDQKSEKKEARRLKIEIKKGEKTILACRR